MIKTAIVTTGDELLTGELVDTNSAWFSDRLFRMGIVTQRHISIGDDHDTIVETINEVSGKYDVAVFSGGLGPTEDDLTVDACAVVSGGGVVIHEESLKQARAVFKRRGFEFTTNNERQAHIPKGARAFLNPVGLAPGFSITSGGCRLYFLPGVPREFKAIAKDFVLPEIEALQSEHEPRFKAFKRIKVIGLPESHLANRLRPVIESHPEIRFGYRAHFPEVFLKMLVFADSLKEADGIIENATAEIQNEFGSRIMGCGDDEMAGVVGGLLKGRGQTLSTAESCTGGLVGKLLTDISGSSEYYKGGAVTYSNEMKTTVLGVNRETIEKRGAVSRECALEMAQGARRRFDTDIAISITGIAGPGGGSEEKPVGLVHFGLASKGKLFHKQVVFRPLRDVVRYGAAMTALDIVRLHLLGDTENLK